MRADPTQLEQIVLNLTVNARDAMPKGGTVEIETDTVELDARYAKEHVGVTPGTYVRLTVTDTGTGMDQATQKRVFEPFFTTKKAGQGTGLGLSIVSNIVKESGGTMELVNNPHGGVTVRIQLPSHSEEASSRAAALGPLQAERGVYESAPPNPHRRR